ncbi:MAG: 4-hydroxy-3-methylbut-2-enyl diphosphate reductase [Dehalococcoidia bacterium]|nr:4-hydroxy-3-methylbut-2-enyl diphosphate reductase [Dehalococcoidia bacterium]
MEIILASPRGFCAGVVRAIDIVKMCIDKFGTPIYVRHEIVHNPHVVNELKERGAIFVDELSDIPPNSTVIFSAHGVSPAVWDEARKKNLHIIDATCPLVTKVHSESIKYKKQGYSIILIGHEGHDEVIGTMGEAPDQTYLIESESQVNELKVAHPEKTIALTQTTLSVEDTKDVISSLKVKFPNLVARNDICYATSNRQEAVKQLASQVDMVLVIGATNSSNCARLREVAENCGIPSYLIDGPEDIDPTWLDTYDKIGVTSGASTPEQLIDAVITECNPAKVSTLEIKKENVSFVLPKELRS